jgi:hypothetical protein
VPERTASASCQSGAGLRSRSSEVSRAGRFLKLTGNTSKVASEEGRFHNASRRAPSGIHSPEMPRDRNANREDALHHGPTHSRDSDRRKETAAEAIVSPAAPAPQTGTLRPTKESNVTALKQELCQNVFLKGVVPECQVKMMLKGPLLVRSEARRDWGAAGCSIRTPNLMDRARNMRSPTSPRRPPPLATPCPLIPILFLLLALCVRPASPSRGSEGHPPGNDENQLWGDAGGAAHGDGFQVRVPALSQAPTHLEPYGRQPVGA